MTLVPTKEVPSTVAEALANWSETNPHTWISADGSNGVASWAEANWAKTTPHTWNLADGSDGAASWAEVKQEDRKPNDVARPGAIRVAADSGPSAVVEVAGMEGLGRTAFWSLLKEANYEEW